MPATRSRGDLQVLVVDDYPDSAESIADLVRIWGWSAESTRCGAEALTIAERAAPKVVILDLGMEPMSGFEVAKRLRTMPGTSRSALLALTGSVPPQRSAEVLSREFDGYFYKPGDLGELKRTIAKFLEPGR